MIQVFSENNVPSNEKEQEIEDRSSVPLDSLECDVSIHNVVGGSVEQCHNTCNKTCQENCGAVLSSWDSNKIDRIQTLFAGAKSIFKSKLICHLTTQGNIGPKVLSLLVGKSEYIIKKVINDQRDGVKQYIHSNLKMSRLSNASVNFIVWMVMFSSKFGQDSPEDLVIVLPSYMYKGTELFVVPN